MKKTTVFWALVAINLVLLVSLLAPFFRSSEAMAQRAASNRRPELIMIPGEVNNASSEVVYLVDTANRRLGAIVLNKNGNGLDVMSPQMLDRVFDERAKDAGKPEKKGGAKK